MSRATKRAADEACRQLFDEVSGPERTITKEKKKKAGRRRVGVCKRRLDRDGDLRDDRRYKTPDQMAFAAAVRTSCEYYGIDVERVRQGMALRGFAMSRASPMANPLEPPADPTQVDAWLAANLFVVGNGGSLATTTCPIALSERCVQQCWLSNPQTRVLAWRQLQLWAQLWCSSCVRVEHVPNAGLGLVAAGKIKYGDEVCRGVVDKDLVDYRCRTLVNPSGKKGGAVGALLGPAALANAMCEKHACVLLQRREHAREMALVACRDIACGEKICFTYEQVGEDPEHNETLVCCKRGCSVVCKS